MDLELTEDQQMLKDMVDRFVADRYDFETRQAILHSPAGWSRDVWGELAELGLLMLPVSESDGGMGGQGVETMIVSEAFGRALLGEPWLATLLSAAVLRQAAEEVRAELLGPLMTGETIYALAHAGDVHVREGRVSGRVGQVLGGGLADRLLIAATGLEGVISVVLVDPAGDGVRRTDYALHGGGRAADVELTNAPVLRVLLEGEPARRALREAQAIGVAALAADALGAAQAAFDLTVDYLKTRVQFGQPIGANQALQHRASEMYVELEQLRSAAILAACSTDEDNEAERSRVDHTVRIVTSKSARYIGQQCVQLHGGIGVTAEASIGHYFLRLTTAGVLFGDSDSSVAALAEGGGIVEAIPYWDVA